MCAAPWTLWIGVGGVPDTVNVSVKSATGLSGGSAVSRSLTPAAATVTWQVAPAGNAEAGVRVNVVGPALTASVTGLPHSIVNADGVTATGSLNVTTTIEPGSTSLLPLLGVVLTTA